MTLFLLMYHCLVLRIYYQFILYPKMEDNIMSRTGHLLDKEMYTVQSSGMNICVV